MNNIVVSMLKGKQYSSVRGSKAKCINYTPCPMCYGCRAYDSRDPECAECRQEDINVYGKPYNICKKELHEGWKLNKLITKNKVHLDNVTFINGGR